MLAPKVTDKANIFYQHFKADVKYVCHANTAHPIPVDLPPDESILARKRVLPGHKKFPYISNSGSIDAAGEVLKHILPPVKKVPSLKERTFDWESKGKFITFDQKEFILSENTALNDYGFLYVPDQCYKKQCDLHVVLSGAG